MKVIAKIIYGALRGIKIKADVAAFLSNFIPTIIMLGYMGIMLFLAIKLLVKQIGGGFRPLPMMATAAHLVYFGAYAVWSAGALIDLLGGEYYGGFFYQVRVILASIENLLVNIVFGVSSMRFTLDNILGAAFWVCFAVAVVDLLYTTIGARFVKDKYESSEVGEALVRERWLFAAQLPIIILVLVLA